MRMVSRLGWVTLVALTWSCGGETETSSGPTPNDAFIAIRSNDPDVDSYTLYALGLDGKKAQLCSGCQAYGVSPDRRYVAFAKYDAALEGFNPFVIHSKEGTRISIGNDVSLYWSPDSERLAFGTEGQAFIANGDGSDPFAVPTANAGTGFMGISWSPDGLHVAFSGEEGVTITDRDGVVVAEIPTPRGWVHWSPDGWRIAVTTYLMNTDQQLDLVNADGSEFSSLSVCTGFVGWSPDGQWLAFADKESGLSIAGADGAVAFSELGANYAVAAWSPLEPVLAYTDTSNPTPILTLWSATDFLAVPFDDEREGWFVLNGSWSPDGSRLLAYVSDGGASGFFTIIDAIDGTQLARFERTLDTGFQELSWSPSGSRLVGRIPTIEGPPSSADVTTLDAAGGNPTVVASGTWSSVWLHDGDHLGIVTDEAVSIVHADGSDRTTFLAPGPNASVSSWGTP